MAGVRRLHGNWLVVLFAVLLLCTIGLAQARFTFGSDLLLSNLDFRSGLDGWAVRPADSQVTAHDGVLTLEQPDTSQFIVVSTRLADVQRFDYLRLSAEIEPGEVVQGELFWQKGRVVLVGRDANGKAMIRTDHVLAARVGSESWSDHQAVFKVLPGMAEMQLSVELPGATGRISVRNLNLRAAEQADWYRAASLVLIAGWAAAALWASGRLLAGRAGLSWRQPALALMLAISFVQIVPELGATRFVPLLPLGFADISGGVTPLGAPEPAQQTMEAAGSVLPNLTGQTGNGGVGFQDAVKRVQLGLQRLDLLAHLAGFVLLTLVLLGLSGARPRTVIPYMLAAALAGEVAQWSVQGQYSSGDLVELTADFLGVALVYLSLALLDRRLSRAA